MPDAPAPFRVLVVCTGNICRSPFAASLLSHYLGPAFEVTSAGTRAMVGEPMTEQMEFLAEEAEAPDPFHRARQLEASMVEAADLVLTATRQQRGDVARLAPARISVLFALTEFARLLDDVADAGEFRLLGASNLLELVPAVAGRRGLALPPADPADDDIVDPYLRSEETYRTSALQIAVAVDRITGAFQRLARTDPR